MGELMSGKGPWDYHGPRVCVVWIDHIPQGVTLDDPIEGRGACHTAEAEWRVVGWLEREGTCIAHDIFAESHLHAGELDLDSYKVLMISAHHEYCLV